jgi:hypothetical protein
VNELIFVSVTITDPELYQDPDLEPEEPDLELDPNCFQMEIGPITGTLSGHGSGSDPETDPVHILQLIQILLWIRIRILLRIHIQIRTQKRI